MLKNLVGREDMKIFPIEVEVFSKIALEMINKEIDDLEVIDREKHN